ncbi:MAG TPA: flagellar biosynthesis protein FlhA [Acidimicrobiales bacterium]|nr:flagellar biosynthesis protein FlhA [Acidimicrobiales bacterium]
MRSNRLTLVGVPTAMVCVVVMLVVPLPTQLIDLLITLNLVASVIILLTAMYVKKALDFSVFPSLLLMATMYRLALNVSVTRQVLLHGQAGNVVAAFGHFVIGGSVVVGLVVFLIIIVIQFVVITNGAGRVAEVAARFTLDAMPGKQMAIDADLNSGLIDKDEARRRRHEVAAEADFYGAMDGASKFVRGDAVAAIVIMAINLVGGLAIGVFQNGDNFGTAINTYSLLSVGDGLAAQLPALLISLSTGLIVTRAGTESDLGSDLVLQILNQRRSVRIAATGVCLLAMVPGLPKLPFLLVGGTVFFLSGRLPADKADDKVEPDAADAAPAPPAPDSPEGLARDMKVEPLELEVAYNLVELVDPTRGGDLLDRVKALRRKIAMEMGVVLPLVRTRDNIDLPASTYTIRVHGAEVARGTALPGHVLAIGDMLGSLPGTPTKEPVFGLDAKWAPLAARAQAERMGATVVDPASVITTHLAEIVKQNAGKLLSRAATKDLVEIAKRSDPTVVEELGTAQVTLAEVHRALRDLLDEGVSVRNLSKIFEVLTEKVRTTRDPETLTEACRQALGPALSAALAADGHLPVITIDPLLEQHLSEMLRASESGSFLALAPDKAEAFTLAVAHRAREAEGEGEMPVLVCAAPLRPAVRKLVKTASPRLPVLSYAELGSQLRLETRGVVNLEQAAV